MPQEGVDVRPVVRMHGDADARRHEQRTSGDAEGTVELGQHPLREPGRLGGALRTGEEHRELVTADARDGVAVAGAGSQPLGHLTQQGVAGVVPQGVVHVLEAVEVKEQDSSARAVAASEREQHPVVEAGPVRQTGERVMVAGELQPLALTDHPGQVHHDQQ